MLRHGESGFFSLAAVRSCERSHSPMLSRIWDSERMGMYLCIKIASLLGNAGQDEPMLPENLDSEWMEL